MNDQAEAPAGAAIKEGRGAPPVPAVPAVGPAAPPPRPVPSKRTRSLVHHVDVGLVALTSMTTALVMVGAPANATAAAFHRVLYSYAQGARWSAGCHAQRDPAMGCSLEDALSQAVGGDTVALATPGQAGHYVGNWRVLAPYTSAAAPVTIAPAPGVAAPVLDGNHGQAKGCQTKACDGTVLFVGARVHLDLRDLIVEDALDRANPHGGGVRNDLGGAVSVSGCTFYDDRASWGGAIDNADANGTGMLAASASKFEDDQAAHGGAISNHGSASVSGSLFSADHATNSGAIDNGDGGGLVVSSSSFLADSARDDGGAIDNADHAGKGTLTVSGSTFRSNSAENGGAISNADHSGDGTLSVQGSRFLGNKSDGDGASIDNAGPVGTGTVSVSASVLSGGTAGRGGGAIANGTGSVSVSTSTLSGNQAQYGTLDNDYDYQPPGPPVEAQVVRPACLVPRAARR